MQLDRARLDARRLGAGYNAHVARCRKPIAVACIALVFVAALLPLGGVSLDWFVVPTAFVLLDWRTPAEASVGSLRCEASITPYLRSINPRGPPRLFLV
jgi:hypothetical protein